ncbi:hypothetical protein DESC_780424 [Desulfosarcina cetonica]|nr:hypothetical protein DESC_780424 [Desulfosarcina cetonica]
MASRQQIELSALARETFVLLVRDVAVGLYDQIIAFLQLVQDQVATIQKKLK